MTATRVEAAAETRMSTAAVVDDLSRLPRAPCPCKLPAMSRSVQLEAGDLLCGRFHVQKLLGRGATAEGYRVADVILDEIVVCKVALESGDRSAAEFREQYRKLRRIRSRDVVQPLGLFMHDGEGGIRAVMALELAEGVHLGDWYPSQSIHDRMKALKRVADALALLHSEGISHGDFLGGVNVLWDEDRCVLIDPFSGSHGKPSGAGEFAGDLESLARLIDEMLPDYARTVLAPVVQGLRAGSRGVADAAAQLGTTLNRSPILIASDPALLAAAESFKSRVQNSEALFDRVRRLRADVIGGLAAQIKELVRPFGITAAYGDDAARMIEGKGQALLADRHITCSSPAGPQHSWQISFDAAHHFQKPWPHGEPGLIAKGRSNVVTGHRPLYDAIRVELSGDAATVLVGARDDGDEWRPADATWMRRCLAALTGSPLVEG